MKRRIGKWILITLCFCLFSGGFLTLIYFQCPEIIEEYYLHRAYADARLQLKTLDFEDGRLEYLEGGCGKETVLFVHGFQGDKRIWLPYMQKLWDRYHLIAMDLPGHGGSSVLWNRDYDLTSMAEFVHQFVQEKGIKHFHLVGISMGGGISTVYASEYPKGLLSLSLLNPYGLITPIKSDLEQEIEKGNNLLFPDTLSDLDLFLQFLTGKPSHLANRFKMYILDKLQKNRIFYQKVFQDLLRSESVEKILPNIRTRTLVLVGERDRVLHHSSLDIYEKFLPEAVTKLIPKGAHVFVGPFFEEAVGQLQAFLNDSNHLSIEILTQQN